MKIKLLNQQTKLRIRPPALRRLAQWLLQQTPLPAKSAEPLELVLVLTDHEGIRAYNRACFGKDRPTDVITQAYAATPGSDGFHGEIIVNAQQALEEGLKRKSIDQELALYIAHGIDHLTGASDHTPAQRARMRRRELGWLRQARQAGCLAEGSMSLIAPNSATGRCYRATSQPP